MAQDFGTLSSKTPITPATIRYTAPQALSESANVPQTITIERHADEYGDFRNEFARQVQIRLLPQGVILPVNRTLGAGLYVHPGCAEGLRSRHLRRVRDHECRHVLRSTVLLWLELW